MKILIIGAGKLGLPLAETLKTQHQVTLLSRSQKPIDGVQQIIKDINSLQKSDFAEPFDVVYVIVSPDDYSVSGYARAYVEPVRTIFEAVFSENTHLIYISSTGVYGQNAGETVDIHTIAQPNVAKDHALYSAEQLYQAFWQSQLTIVRPSGLLQGMPYESEFLLKKATTTDSLATVDWLNLIARSKVVENLAKLAGLVQEKRILPAYIFTDICQPRHELYNAVRQRFGLPNITVADNAPHTGKRLVNTEI